MGRIADAVRRLVRKFASPPGGEDGWRALADFLGVDAEDRSAMSEATYYACVKTLSESVGKMPFRLLRTNERNGVEVMTGHPVYGVVADRPNRYMTAAGFWSTVEQNPCHFGNAYCLIKGSGSSTSLWALPSNEVEVVYDDARRVDERPDIYYLWSSPTGPVLLGSEEVLHFRTFDTFDGIKGVPVLDRLRDTVGGNRASQRVLNDLYESNLSQKMVMSYTSDLSSESAREMARIVSDYAAGRMRDRGVDNVIPVPVGTTIAPLNMKMADTQFLELRRYSAIQIASAFGIKPYQIGDYGKESYSSQTAQNLSFYKDTLMWILGHYEQEISYKLLSPAERRSGMHFKANVQAILRADLETQVKTLTQGISGGLYVPNEARALIDLEAKEGGDELLVNGNAIPVRMAGAQYAPAAAGEAGGSD